MGSLCTRSGEPVSPPFGQRNCPEMDSCAQGRAYRKWNHTQYLWLPRGLATHWPGHPAAADRHADSRLSKSFSQGQPPSSIRHTFRLQEETTSFVLLTMTAPLTSHFLCCAKHRVMEARIPLCYFQRILSEYFICFLGCIFLLID